MITRFPGRYSYSVIALDFSNSRARERSFRKQSSRRSFLSPLPAGARELPRSNDQVLLGDLSGRNESFARSFLTLTGTRSRERIAINPRHNFLVSGQQAPARSFLISSVSPRRAGSERKRIRNGLAESFRAVGEFRCEKGTLDDVIFAGPRRSN